jgi:hypothetical protein
MNIDIYIVLPWKIPFYSRRYTAAALLKSLALHGAETAAQL